MSENENKPRLSPEKTAALTVAFTIAGTGIASAQEQDPALSPEPTTEPNPLAEYCDIPASNDADSQELSNGDIVVFESPAPNTAQEEVVVADNNQTENESQNTATEEELSSFDRLSNLFSQEEYPNCDFELVSKGILSYYEDHPKQAKDVKNKYGLTPEQFIGNAKKELEKKNVKKRNITIIADGMAPALLTFSKTGDEDAYALLEPYMGATANEVDTEEYQQAIQFALGFSFEDLEKLDKKLAKEKEKTTEVKIDQKDYSYKRVLKSKVNSNHDSFDLIFSKNKKKPGILDKLYSNPKYTETLSKLDIYEEPASTKRLKTIFKRCKQDEFGLKTSMCSSAAIEYVHLAQQTLAIEPTENNKKIADAFMKAAVQLRSIAVNTGVSKKEFDTSFEEANNFFNLS